MGWGNVLFLTKKTQKETVPFSFSGSYSLWLKPGHFCSHLTISMKIKPTQGVRQSQKILRGSVQPEPWCTQQGTQSTTGVAFHLKQQICCCWSQSVLFLAPETIQLTQREAGPSTIPAETRALLEVLYFLSLKWQEVRDLIGFWEVDKKKTEFILSGWENEAATKIRTRNHCARYKD